MFRAAFVALALAHSACAVIFFTSPTATIGFTAGQNATITWTDDGVSPTVAEFGLAKASISTGNSASQTALQVISASVDTTLMSLSFTPDATIGPDGNQYFIRFDSLNLKDAKDAAIPALAFSHQFSLSGMSGTFNAAVLSQIAGQSTAPIGGGAPTAAAPSGSATAAPVFAASASASASKAPTLTTSKAVSAASATASKSASAAPVQGSSAAVPSFVASQPRLWLGIVTGVFGAAVGAALL